MTERHVSGILKLDGARNFGAKSRIWVGGHHREARRLVDQRLADAARPPSGSLDAGFIVPKSIEEAVYFATKLSARLTAEGSLWVIYPRTAPPGATESFPTAERLREALERAGFTPTSTSALSANLSASLFHRVNIRAHGPKTDS